MTWVIDFRKDFIGKTTELRYFGHGEKMDESRNIKTPYKISANEMRSRGGKNTFLAEWK
jgi:hypothetical protein